MPNSGLSGNAHSTFPGPDHNSGVWYPDDDHAIPYLLRFHARQGHPLDRADLARWISSPVVCP